MNLDLTYTGGFQLAVDVDMVFGKSAFLSVTVTKLEGTARLQFTRIPYTHWSFSFIEVSGVIPPLLTTSISCPLHKIDSFYQTLML